MFNRGAVMWLQGEYFDFPCYRGENGRDIWQSVAHWQVLNVKCLNRG